MRAIASIVRVSVLFLWLLAEIPLHGLTAAISRENEAQGKHRCVPIKEIPMCTHVKYQAAAFPNFKQQYLPNEANIELRDYHLLINSGCSNAVVYLLCSVYAPLCYSTIEKNVETTKALPPCRNLCEHVSESCRSVVEDYGLTWPPGPHLNCSGYPVYGKLCFGPKNPSVLPAIDVITDLEETVCEARISGISTTTVGITVTPGHNTTSDDASITTDIVCSPALTSNITIRNNNSFALTDLDPNIEYSCTVQQNTSSSTGTRTESCSLQFITQAELEIELVNDTPRVTNRTVQLDIHTNRPVSTMECHIADHRADCLNGTVLFTQLEPDFHTIRIVARNGREDQTTLRARVRVPESPDHCGVNLINRQWVEREGNLTMWFTTFGPVETIQCRVNSLKASPCSSPHTLHLDEGDHKVKVIPKGKKCGKRSQRTINVSVD